MCCQERYLSLFHIKCVDIPNLELRGKFLAVFNKWENVRKSKYNSILQRNWGFYSTTYLELLLLCYVTGIINDNVPSDVVAMTHKIHSNSKISAASQKCSISWAMVGKYSKLQRHIYSPVDHLWWSSFAKIVNGQKSLIVFAKSCIIDVRQCSKYAYELYFKLEKTPPTKYINACVVKSSFFSKFNVFTTVSPKSIKPVNQ